MEIVDLSSENHVKYIDCGKPWGNEDLMLQ